MPQKDYLAILPGCCSERRCYPLLVNGSWLELVDG
jgi:hypothetical protein